MKLLRVLITALAVLDPLPSGQLLLPNLAGEHGPRCVGEPGTYR